MHGFLWHKAGEAYALRTDHKDEFENILRPHRYVCLLRREKRQAGKRGTAKPAIQMNCGLFYITEKGSERETGAAECAPEGVLFRNR